LKRSERRPKGAPTGPFYKGAQLTACAGSVLLRAARGIDLFRFRKSAQAAAKRIEMTISFDDPTPASIRLEVLGAKHCAIAWLTESEARELANELLKAAGAMANF
jgi:hypothetical protein